MDKFDGETDRILLKGRKSEFDPPLTEEQRNRGVGMITAEIMDRDVPV